MSLNKWEVYELLKGSRNYNIEQLRNTEKEIIIEGIEEYAYSNKNRTKVENINKMISDNMQHIPTIY